MVFNRGFAVGRLLKTAQKIQQGVQNQPVRHSGGAYVYRTCVVPDKRNILIAEVLGGLSWYWILYHVISEPEHLIGEFPYPEPSKWTDAELGIPPDDE